MQPCQGNRLKSHGIWQGKLKIQKPELLFLTTRHPIERLISGWNNILCKDKEGSYFYVIIFRTLTVDRKIQIKKKAEEGRAITLVVTRGTSYHANVIKQLVGQDGKIEKIFSGLNEFLGILNFPRLTTSHLR